MEQDNFASGQPVSSPAPEPRRDAPTTVSDTTGNVATTPRHAFTMTIQDVAFTLRERGFERDIRTIQRWCKSGKIKSITDQQNGDRYLVLPSSVDELVATLESERARQDLYAAAATRTEVRQEPTPSHDVTRQAESTTGTQERHDASADDVSSDEVAALRDRVSKLEMENTKLHVDNRVRDEMVEYQRQLFEKSWADAREDLVEVGILRAEVELLRNDNDRLRAMLPPAPEGSGSGFKPRTVMEDDIGL